MLNTYEGFVKVFEALSHPARIKILGVLASESQYVSELSRMLNISRPLLYMHLRKIEAAGLIEGYTEISASGKANKYYRLVEFEFIINNIFIAELAETISLDDIVRNK